MRHRRVVPVVGLVIALTLTSCTSGGGGPATSTAANTPTAANTLAAALQRGVARLTSAHFVLTGTLGGQPLSGAGDQRIAAGKLTGLQATATLPTVGDVGIVVDGTQRYVKVPPPLATAAKPWLRVTADSSNLVVKQFAGVLDAALAAGNLGGLHDLVAAAGPARTVGTDTVAGTPATRYAVTVDPAKLSTSGALGTASIPFEVWVDAQDRPLKVHATLTVLGQPVDVTVTFSNFDAPVTITAPPASQVAAG